MAFPGGYLVLWAPIVINYTRIRNIGNVWYGGIKSVLLLVVYVWLMVYKRSVTANLSSSHCMSGGLL